MGMTFVTITDHNEIAGSVMLKEKYPEHVFTGIEVTTYFPENGCKIHVLVYGLNEQQFHMIDKLRTDIYQLRDYLKQQELAHTVAHATYAINKKLTIEYIERLFLLFDYFEGINGSRSRIANDTLVDTLSALTPARIDDLYRQYRIEPFSDTPWIKGLTAGTDDHSGLFIGKTYTEGCAETPEEFIDRLKKKEISPAGRHNDYQGLAFAIYKIAYDFSQSRRNVLSSSLFSSINNFIFEDKNIGLKSTLMIKKMKYLKNGRENGISRLIVELIETLQSNKELTTEERLTLLYNKISEVADHLFNMFIKGVEQDLIIGDMLSLIKRISTSIPGVFMALPFFTTMNLLHESRSMLTVLAQKYGSRIGKRKKRVLLFTDTLDDDSLETILHNVKTCSLDTYDDCTVVSCLPEHTTPANTTLNWINLPHIYTCTTSLFRDHPLQFPSVLASLKIICDADPDEIYLATPGPVGILGLLVSRLLHVQCSSMYNNNLEEHMLQSAGDDGFSMFAREFFRWFYSFTDTIIVPTEEHIHILEQSGYEKGKMIVSTERFKMNLLDYNGLSVAAKNQPAV